MCPSSLGGRSANRFIEHADELFELDEGSAEEDDSENRSVVCGSFSIAFESTMPFASQDC